ncbi:hypothetical protein L1987_07110 [Smallanthus sonchifolius]|uniref:Uncharacterized protein n=1 Tax=Smallanthus sonchifolius TaxID=185202 RepID=A0ACB9K046_9ASTR|nr:hypothetical protein L1987_07110 [Smallanthus sonchifolius]
MVADLEGPIRAGLQRFGLHLSLATSSSCGSDVQRFRWVSGDGGGDLSLSHILSGGSLISRPDSPISAMNLAILVRS